MDSAKKRERKANFSDEEVRVLLEGIGVEKDAINCKLQGSMTARGKKEAWARVCQRVNAVGKGASRTQDELMKKWRDMKSAVLKEQTYQTKTGGGGPMKETPFKELILYIIGDRSDVVSGIEVTGTDSFLAASTLETLLEIEEEDGSVCSFQRMASTSNTSDPASSQLFTMTKRTLSMPSACITTATSSETSGVDVGRQQEELLSTVPQVSEDGTSSTLKRKRCKRRRQSVSNTGEGLLDSWLSAEIELKTDKKELGRSKIEVNRSQIEAHISQIELNRSQIEAHISQIELNRSQIELNAVLKQESLLRIQDLQTRYNSGQNL